MALNFRRSLVAGVFVAALLPFLHGNKKPAVLQLHLRALFFAAVVQDHSSACAVAECWVDNSTQLILREHDVARRGLACFLLRAGAEDAARPRTSSLIWMKLCTNYAGARLRIEN